MKTARQSPRKHSYISHDVLSLPGDVLAEPAERALASLYINRAVEPPNVLLDLRDASYLDVSALCCLIAFAKSRADRQKRTRFRLPSDKRVRDFLNLWRFPQVLAETVGVSAHDLFTSADHPLLDEPISYFRAPSPSIAALEFDSTWTPSARSRRNFFEFYSFPLRRHDRQSIEEASVPRAEALRWQGELIKAVLKNHLSANQSDAETEVSRVVIYEALANAVQHPQATRILVTSRFAHASQKDVESGGHLTLCVWDDGQSMIETLGSALRSQAGIRAFRFHPTWYNRISLTLRDLDDTVLCSRVVDEGEDPRVDATPELIFLACLFPGVTRRLVASVPTIHPLQPQIADPTSQDTDSAVPNAPGMGLYTLTRTVIDRCGGELALRSGHYFMSLKMAYDALRSDTGAHYRASLKVFPETYLGFKGNLLVIRLPVRR